MAGDIFTLDADNNAAVRTVPVNAAASETNSPVIFTTDEDGNTAVRTVPVNAGASETNSPVIFTTDENGNAAVRVVGAGGGSAPVIDELNVTPSTSAQTITAPSGVDGYNPVNVAAVTSAIDANIVAGNIKKDVEILGVTGSYEGQVPTGTKSITANGVYDVTDFASADVQVPTTAPSNYIAYTNANGTLTKPTNIDYLLQGVTILGEKALYYSCYSLTSLTSVDFLNITTLSGQNCCSNAFAQCTNLTTADLSSVTTVSGSSACQSMFQGCTNLTDVDLSSLTTVSGFVACNQMFSNCTKLTNVNIGSLTTIGGGSGCTRMFSQCSSLKSVSFTSLVNMSSGAFQALESCFYSCSSLENIYFPALKSTSFGSISNQFHNIVQNITGCTIHFPSNLDPTGGSTVISSLTGYPNFGGTNTVLAFDLPATE